MAQKRTGRRIIRSATETERVAYREALAEERTGMEANKAMGREVLRERQELSATVSELKAIRESLGISLTELSDRTGMTVGNLSRLEHMEGSNPTIETIRRYAAAIGHRIEIAVVADT